MALVYDTGALVAAERRDRAMWALHDQALVGGVDLVVPVVVLAQAWRGGPQHNVSRLLKGCLMIDIDEPMSRQAGTLCAAAGTSDIVDALVVVIALRYRAAVVTSDPSDIGRLATSSGHDVPIRPT